MYKAIVFFYGFYLAGFILKPFHIPYNAVLMLIALGGILIISLLSALRKNKEVDFLLHIGVWSWLTLLLISIKFFPFSTIWLFIALLLSIAVCVNAYKKKKLSKLLLSGMPMLFALGFYFIPTNERYYLMNIKWNYEIESDFRSWDKYAWFLYQNDKYVESLNASDHALQIAKKSGDKKWVDFIEIHNNKIKEKSWHTYL